MTDAATLEPSSDKASRIPTEVQAAAETVGEAFRASVTVWGASDESDWLVCGVSRARELGEPVAGHIDSGLLDEVASSGTARLLTVGNVPSAAVALPTLNGVRHVGVLAVRISEAEQINRIAVDALCRERLTEQVSSLSEENDAFAVQLTSDLEELTFLRSVVDRMGSSSHGGLVTMAKQTLPLLNTSVRAESLVLLTTGDAEKPSVVLEHVGSEPSPQMLEEIVERFGGAAKASPVVRNWTETSVESDSTEIPGVRSLIIVSAYASWRRFGWLIAINRSDFDTTGVESAWQLNSDEFGSGEATLMDTTASTLAMQAANVEMLREKEQILVNVVRSLVSAIEAKDEYTRGHSERVALYSRRLAEEMGYLEDEGERMYLAALLHDVGKIGVADATLKKPGKLSDEEFEEISKHPDEGWSILCDLQQLRYVLPGVLHHHERWDGKGYPDKLAGADIPLDGRIMAVADAYDAMTSDRPYRKGMPTEKAEGIIRDGSGTQWDPECVKAFFDCVDDIRCIKENYTQRERKQRQASQLETEAQ